MITVIGDIASNHAGNLQVLLKLCHDVASAGAVPKIQLYSDETFPTKWLGHLAPNCFIASVFRPGDIDVILPYQPMALKVASVEATYTELVDKCLSTGLPVIISTGGMNEDEFIELAMKTRARPDVTLMHCVSAYPALVEHLNLYRIASMADILDDIDGEQNLGFSCHSLFAGACLAAMALGATVFEVHVRPEEVATITADTECSLNTSQLVWLVNGLNDLNLALDQDAPFEGVDRPDVLKWRKRWQEK